MKKLLKNQVLTCGKCNGVNIKSKKNYSHGRNSKPVISFSCKNCGSANIAGRYPSNRRGDFNSKNKFGGLKK